MPKKHIYIGRVLIMTILLTIIGLKVNNKTIADSISDILSADINKKNLHLVSINKYINPGADNVRYIGHRGASGCAPENTLPAFEQAGKLGYWGAECDVRTTTDGKWIILHDETVDRMTDGNGKIQSLTYKELESLNIDSGANIAQYKDLKVPKLEEYLSVCRKCGLTPVIEMKQADNLQYYDEFLLTIKNYEGLEKPIVISLSSISLNELRKRDNNLVFGLLCTDINQDTIDYVKSLGKTFIDCYYMGITKDKVDLCHFNNIKVGAWTVDNKEILNNLISDGVDFLTSDYYCQNH